MMGFVFFVSPNLKKIVALVSGEGSEMLADGDYERECHRCNLWVSGYAVLLCMRCLDVLHCNRTFRGEKPEQC